MAHTEFSLNDETLRAPRIVLVAGSFPVNVTATAVWLSEMGIDISLTRVLAYQTPAGVVVTASQHYPPADVQDFLVAPTRASRRARNNAPELPEEPWTPGDFIRLATEVKYVTIHKTMDLCSEQPGQWIPSDAVQAATGRETAKHRGDYGGFGVTVRTRFKRSNQPFEMNYGALGTNQQCYRVSAEVAQMWLAAQKTLLATTTASHE